MKPPVTAILGRNARALGVAPAIALHNPKYAHNVGAAVRAASCFGIRQVWFSGDRVSLSSKVRLPREERMRGFREVELRQHDFYFDQFESVTPVAVEVWDTAELSHQFVHPANPLYVFGPEDGTIPQSVRRHCHRFVRIPLRHCANLAAAVYMILYDRMVKRLNDGVDQAWIASDDSTLPDANAELFDLHGKD